MYHMVMIKMSSFSVFTFTIVNITESTAQQRLLNFLSKLLNVKRLNYFHYSAQYMYHDYSNNLKQTFYHILITTAAQIKVSQFNHII